MDIKGSVLWCASRGVTQNEAPDYAQVWGLTFRPIYLFSQDQIMSEFLK